VPGWLQLQKKTLRASEQQRRDVRRARRVWRQHRQPRMRMEPHRLVFIDETSVTTKLTRLRGRAPRGERLHASAPFGQWARQTFIAALRASGLTAPWVIDGSLNRARFETYVETQLAPTLQRGDVVILDNVNPHNSARAGEIVRQCGAWLLFLPKYSPDLNPIELAFSKVKAHLRATGARSYHTLITAIGNICDLFNQTECWNFLKHAGIVSRGVV
jgi:transposase